MNESMTGSFRCILDALTVIQYTVYIVRDIVPFVITEAIENLIHHSFSLYQSILDLNYFSR